SPPPSKPTSPAKKRPHSSPGCERLPLIPINVVYNSTTKTVVITPVSQLARAANYTVTITGGTSGIRDRFGNLLPADVSWSFKTQ
ncbi:MAG: Ig-like domain-containing protein, partial [Pirellulales bacterium]|nr:Ig-like domain-containing protein [Pirellulales bacterium]